jgi:hypothetical protein
MAPRLIVPLFGVVALVGLVVALPSLAEATGILPPENPTSNIFPPSNYAGPCAGVTTATAACPIGLGTVDADRGVEGLAPMSLPTNFAALTVQEQIFVLTNLERVDRGLPPVSGLATDLDTDAQTGAVANADPAFPAGSTDDGTNWSAGSIFTADVNWMYDDGFDGATTTNTGCTSAAAADCWDHRDNILATYSTPLLMGAGDVAGGAEGGSVTQIFVGQDTTDTPYFSWTSVTPNLPIGISESTVSDTVAAGSTTTNTIELWASGEAMNLTLAVAGSGDGFTVSPTNCNLTAGSSCTVTVTFAPTTSAPVSATLAVTGPNGAQDIILDGNGGMPTATTTTTTGTGSTTTVSSTTPTTVANSSNGADGASSSDDGASNTSSSGGSSLAETGAGVGLDVFAVVGAGFILSGSVARRRLHKRDSTA